MLVLTGLCAGLLFTFHPASYHFSGAIVLTTLFLSASWKDRLFATFPLVVSMAIFPVAIASCSWLYKSWYAPEHFDYVSQCINLSKTVKQGIFHETPWAPLKFFLENHDYAHIAIFALLLATLFFAPIRNANAKLVTVIACIYCTWQIQGFLLHREVLYGRTAAIATPLLSLFGASVLAQLNGILKDSANTILRRLRPTIFGLGIVTLVTSQTMYWKQPIVRVRPEDIASHVAKKLLLSPDQIQIHANLLDCGEELPQHFLRLQRLLESVPSENENQFVVFNLRGGGWPGHPQLVYGAEPILIYPGNGRTDISYLSRIDGPPQVFQMRTDDIRVFRLSDLVNARLPKRD